MVDSLPSSLFYGSFRSVMTLVFFGIFRAFLAFFAAQSSTAGSGKANKTAAAIETEDLAPSLTIPSPKWRKPREGSDSHWGILIAGMEQELRTIAETPIRVIFSTCWTRWIIITL